MKLKDSVYDVLKWLILIFAPALITFISGLGVVLGLWFNNRGFFGLLPIIANLEYTIAVFRFKDNEKALKIAFMICTMLFAVFNTVILNLVGVAANLVVIVSTIVFLIKDKK